VLVDCDDGYGDEKNVVHTIHTYDDIGASAILMEDQKSPKRCGHLGGKKVIEPNEMVNKIRAACSARRDSEQLFTRHLRKIFTYFLPHLIECFKVLKCIRDICTPTAPPCANSRG
jgi:hypothetical protein